MKFRWFSCEREFSVALFWVCSPHSLSFFHWEETHVKLCFRDCERKYCLLYLGFGSAVHLTVCVCVCVCAAEQRRTLSQTSLQSAERFVLQGRRSLAAWGSYLCIFVCVFVSALRVFTAGKHFTRITALMLPPTIISHRLCSVHKGAHNKRHCCFSHMQF